MSRKANTVAAIVAAALLGPSYAARADDAREIFSKNTAFHVTGSDKLVVYGISDPLVDGVACHFTAPKRGGISGALGFAEEVSDVSLSCRQVGPISFKGKFAQGSDAFAKGRSIFMKQMHVARGCDAATNEIVYMVYSDKLVDGSPKNSTSDVPIMPWGDSKSVPKCADFLE